MVGIITAQAKTCPEKYFWPYFFNYAFFIFMVKFNYNNLLHFIQRTMH